MRVPYIFICYQYKNINVSAAPLVTKIGHFFRSLTIIAICISETERLSKCINRMEFVYITKLFSLYRIKYVYCIESYMDRNSTYHVIYRTRRPRPQTPRCTVPASRLEVGSTATVQRWPGPRLLQDSSDLLQQNQSIYHSGWANWRTGAFHIAKKRIHNLFKCAYSSFARPQLQLQIWLHACNCKYDCMHARKSNDIDTLIDTQFKNRQIAANAIPMM